ncbi:MAG: ribonuclease HIII [Candidatus Aenigmarchaeota archaeon]|nr:ribonuclease HIII [Candidatus Aenigmarchaeota archaeon]
MPHIGVDEAGKGDYFGYLVVAAVYVDDQTESRLKALGVKDSKMLSDAAVKGLAAKIRKLCMHDIVRISPEKYNMLYAKFKSLNRLLAWGHSRAIENVLDHVECDVVITDKFGDEKLVKDALFEKGKKVQLLQRIHAEQDTAVAAASILARQEFLATLRMLGREVGMVLPKGATHVEDAARQMVQTHGTESLGFVAKLHFKITKRILAQAAK